VIPTNTEQTSFTSGELSPLILGRNDVEKFGMGGEAVENFIPISQGPLVRRPGTQFLSLESEIFRLIPFVFSKDQVFIIQMYDQRMAIRAPDGTVMQTLVVPYTIADVWDVTFAQSADVIFFAHQNYPPARLSHYGDYDWRFDNAPIKNGPFQDYTEYADTGVILYVKEISDETPLYYVTNDDTITDTTANINVGDYVAFNKNGYEVIGIVTSMNKTTGQVMVSSLEDTCNYLDKEVFAVGVYTGWDDDNGVPTYSVIPDIEGDPNEPYIQYKIHWRSSATHLTGTDYDPGYGGGYAYITLPSSSPPPDSSTPGWPNGNDYNDIVGTQTTLDPTGAAIYNYDVTADIMFSNTYAMTRDMVHGQLHFISDQGYWYWGEVYAVDNILKSGAYGIIGKIRFLPVKFPLPGVSVTCGDRTITATIRSETSVFDSTRDTGRPVRLVFDQSIVHAMIDHVDDEFSCAVTLDSSLPPVDDGPSGIQTQATTYWDFGAWHTGNYPACVCFFDDRLTYAASFMQPQTVWMSQTGDYYNFAPTNNDSKVVDTNAINITLASTTMNKIMWVLPRNVLIIGTMGNEWILDAGAQNIAVTPTNLRVRLNSAYGSEIRQSFAIAMSAIYIQRGSTKMRDMSYDFQHDSFLSMDLTVFSEHILRQGGGVASMDFILNPNPIFFCVLADGTFAILAYEPDQKVYSWCRWSFHAPVRSVLCIDSAQEHGAYLCVEEGPSQFSFEYLNLDDISRISPMAHSDRRLSSYPLSSMTWNAVTNRWNVSLMSGYDTVYINDELVYDAVLLPNGQYELPARFDSSLQPTKFVQGISYVSLFRSFPMDIRAQMGSVQAKTKRMEAVRIRFKDTVFGKVGTNQEKYPLGQGRTLMVYEEFKNRSDVIFNPQVPSSFDYRVPLPNGFDRRAQYEIVQDKSYPMTILAVYPETHISE
jgi:hypothetical protein